MFISFARSFVSVLMDIRRIYIHDTAKHCRIDTANETNKRIKTIFIQTRLDSAKKKIRNYIIFNRIRVMTKPRICVLRRKFEIV